MSKNKLQFLIVDEDPDAHCGFAEILMFNYNAQVHFADTNACALEKARERKYDVVMYDVGMENSRTGQDFPVVDKLREFSGEDTFFLAMSLCACETGYHLIKDRFDGFIETLSFAEERIEYLQKKGVKLEKD